jgi:uncharacterized membrane protein YeiB
VDHHGRTQPELSPVPPPTRRLIGLDLARATAFAGMLLAHYVAPHRPGESGWLLAVDAAADGRAAPLFCVLLGIGAGLLIARGTADRVLVRRGVALFVLGLAIWPYFGRVYLILPHYGLLLAVVPLLRRLSNRGLLVGAALAFTVPALVAAAIDGHHLRAGAQPTSYGDLLDVADLARVLLWTGGYPLVGWVGFVLVGLWLARQPLGDRSVQLRLLLVGAGIALLQPVLAWIHTGLGEESTPTAAGGLGTFFDGQAHSNRTAWYVLGTATALAVLGAALLLTSHAATRWHRPLVCLGQLALSAYVAHLLVGRQLVWAWNDRSQPSVAVQMAVLGVVLVTFAALATMWRSRYRRGPLEGLLRAVSG